MEPFSSQEFLKKQYADSANLAARNRLHQQFRVNKYGWWRWVFDQLDGADLPANGDLLEVGCGTGWLWGANRDRVPRGWHITLSDASAGMVEEARNAVSDSSRPIDWGVFDVQQIPRPDASFDAVVANHMLYHVTDLTAGLREIVRVPRPVGWLFATTNGMDHTRELRELVAQVAPDATFCRNLNAEAFGLENAPALLGGHFAEVTVRRYEDSLWVTEAEAVIDYILSIREASLLDDAKIAHLRQSVRDRIAADGGFHVTKSQANLLQLSEANRPWRGQERGF